jgi:hypothetical protein
MGTPFSFSVSIHFPAPFFPRAALINSLLPLKAAICDKDRPESSLWDLEMSFSGLSCQGLISLS